MTKTVHATIAESRMTTLRAEGFISGGRVRRSTVRADAAARSFDTLMSCSSWARSLGRVPTVLERARYVGSAGRLVFEFDPQREFPQSRGMVFAASPHAVAADPRTRLARTRIETAPREAGGAR